VPTATPWRANRPNPTSRRRTFKKRQPHD
jgi:hypothetical protein